MSKRDEPADHAGDANPPTRAGAPRIRLDALPGSLRWAVWLLLAEAAGLVAVVALLAYEDAAASSVSRSSGVALTVLTAGLAALLGLLAVSLSRRRRWARGPAIVMQLLLLPIGYYMASGGVPALGVPVIIVGLIGAGALLAPSTRASLGLD